MPQRSDSCPWCGEAFGPSADPVTVTVDRYPFPGERLHRNCATEWESFIARAGRLAESGARHSLIVAPLERGWALEAERDCQDPPESN